VVADIEHPDGADGGSGDLNEDLDKGSTPIDPKSPVRRPPKSGKTGKGDKKPDWGL
jgi:hypothetical protein